MSPTHVSRTALPRPPRKWGPWAACRPLALVALPVLLAAMPSAARAQIRALSSAPAAEAPAGGDAPAVAGPSSSGSNAAFERLAKRIATEEERLVTTLPLLPPEKANRRISDEVVLPQIPVGELISLLGEKEFLDINIVVATNADLSQPFDLIVSDMTLGEIFDLVLQLHELKAVRFNENTLIIVDQTDRRTFGVRKEKIYRLTYTTPENVLSFIGDNDTLAGILDPANFIVDARNNSILALDSPDNLVVLEHVISLLDAKSNKVTARIPISHIDENDIQTAIQALPAEIRDRIDISESIFSEDGRTLIVHETPEDLELLRDIIRQIDIGRKQALIDAAIMEVTETVARDLGLTLIDSSFQVSRLDRLWNLDRLRTDIGQTSTSAASISYLLQRQGGNTIANPKVRVIDGESATLNVGQIRNVRIQTAQFASNQLQTTQQTTFNTQEVPIGVTLTVTPEIHNDGTLTLELDVSDEAIITINDFGVDRTTRNTQSLLRVRDGETVIMGGFINRQVSYDKTPVPILGKLPLLKNLFRRNQRQQIGSELVILLTPYILDYDPVLKKTEVSLVPRGDSLAHLAKQQLGYENQDSLPASKTTVTRWVETKDARTKVIYDAQGDVIYKRSWPLDKAPPADGGADGWTPAPADRSAAPAPAGETPPDVDFSDLYDEPLTPPDASGSPPAAAPAASDPEAATAPSSGGGSDGEWEGLMGDLNSLIGSSG